MASIFWKQNHKAVIYGVLVSLVLFGTIAVKESEYRQGVSLTIARQNARIAELDDIRLTAELASEFSFDPKIVQAVRRASKYQFDANRCVRCSTWRFVRTADDLAYLLLSIVRVESSGNPEAYNAKGRAYGLFQLQLPTAQDYEKDVTAADLLTIQKNVDISARHFVVLLKKYGGNFTLAVLAWNRGVGAVDRVIQFGEPLENGYIRKVLSKE